MVLLGDRSAHQLLTHFLHLCRSPEVAGGCRGVSEVSSRARQVPDKPGLSAGTEGFSPIVVNMKGKRMFPLLFSRYVVILCRLCQNVPYAKMSITSKCSGFARSLKRKSYLPSLSPGYKKPCASRQRQLLEARSLTTRGVLLVPVWCEGTKPSEGTTVECWTWAQVMLTDRGWAVSPFPSQAATPISRSSPCVSF